MASFIFFSPRLRKTFILRGQNSNQESGEGLLRKEVTDMTAAFKDIPPIAKDHFTLDYEKQLACHRDAKTFLGTLDFVNEAINPSDTVLPPFTSLTMTHRFDSSIIKWENTSGVEEDIQESAKKTSEVHIYGVASQFNGCEAMSRYTIKPGYAYDKYKMDPTQGPRAQIQFSKYQVEALNASANLGFNGLIALLDEKTKTSVRHGYFTPDSKKSGDILIERLRTRGNEIEYVSAASIPERWEWKSKSTAKWNTDRPENTEVVHGIMVAAPAFGGYRLRSDLTEEQELECQYLCASRAMEAQLKYVLKVRESTSAEKLVVFKPTSPGLGVFGNSPEAVATGVYRALSEFEPQLKAVGGIEIRFQVFRGRGAAKKLADLLHLEQFH